MNRKEKSFLNKDLWLSEILEKPCFNLICEKRSNLNNILKTLPKNNYFVSSKVNSDDLENLIKLQKKGFKIVDFSYSLKKNYCFEKFSKHDTIDIQEATPDDKEEVAEIAFKAFKYSRFHKDSLISKKKAAIIKREWAKNYFSGKRGDLMLVASMKNNLVTKKKHSRIKGFLLLKKTTYLNKEQAISIDLIAIDPEFSGLGIGNELIKNMITKFKEEYIFLVGTQSTNISALSLYSKYQFKLENSFFNLHLHN